MPAILLTRPIEAAARFAAALHARLGAARVVISPLMRIEWLDAQLAAGVPIFTSANGVRGFLLAGGLADGPCWCVGEATAGAARAAGFRPNTGTGDAEALAAAIIAQGARGPFLHVHGRHVRGDLANRLRAGALACEEAIVYDQVAIPPTPEALALLKSEKPVVLPLFSPRSAVQVAKVADIRAPLFLAAMSQAVADAAALPRFARLDVAPRPDSAAMLDVVERLFDAALRLEGEPGAK